MTIFTRHPKPSPDPAPTSYSVLDPQMTVRGDVETDGPLRVDGRLEGSILRADLVVIGTGAAVIGDVVAREVVIGGSVTGNVSASTRVELQATGGVSGDIDASSIIIQEGGTVQGRLSINPIAASEGRNEVTSGSSAPRLQAAFGGDVA